MAKKFFVLMSLMMAVGSVSAIAATASVTHDSRSSISFDVRRYDSSNEQMRNDGWATAPITK
ncbi:MAG TPA: hypothetical protein V6C97_15060 [Oculatellaceae cyanobacterium]